MTGEELNRKYWEINDYLPTSNGVWLCPLRDGEMSRRYTYGLPALHLDANLAIAEALKVFQQWTAGNGPSDDPEQDTIFSGWVDRESITHVDGYGRNFCEAILKALIAAKEQNRG